MPPAPGLLSTRNGRPRSSASRAATSRVTMSTAPPGGNGSMMRTGRSGYSAHAGMAASRTASAAPSEHTCRMPPRMASLLSHVLRQPVRRIIDADLPVVHVGVLGATLLGAEDLQ